jgi:hypothetical protein
MTIKQKLKLRHILPGAVILWLVIFVVRNSPKGRRTPPPAMPQLVAENSIIIDMISVGTTRNPDLQTTQHETFGLSARNFIKVNELDDFETDCHLQLTQEHVVQVRTLCDSHSKTKQPLLYILAPNLFNPNTNPGWLCAQKRPMAGLLRWLERAQETSLPDYLLIFDDDTYVNMNRLRSYLSTLSSSAPMAIASVLLYLFNSTIPSWFIQRVLLPLDVWPSIALTIPHGGYGTIFSRGLLERLVQPLRCKGHHHSSLFEANICRQVRLNRIGERTFFRDGMHLIDLMNAYVHNAEYLKVHEWGQGPGFCMHSDWVWAYFVNYYQLTEPPPASDMRWVRNRFKMYRANQCQGYNWRSVDFDFCHRQTADTMQWFFHHRA